jgi:hypothetical protein
LEARGPGLGDRDDIRVTVDARRALQCRDDDGIGRAESGLASATEGPGWPAAPGCTVCNR